MKEMLQANARLLLLSVLILSNSAVALAYYHPEEGRWLSRDPLEDIGSIVNIVPLPKSPTITEDEMAVSRQLEEIMNKLEAYASSAGITLDQQVLVKLRNEIGLELQAERGTRSASTDRMPKLPMNHLYRFVENNPISNIDPYGLICFPISSNCEVCTWPNCRPPRRPPLPCDIQPPPEDPTGIICIHCTF